MILTNSKNACCHSKQANYQTRGKRGCHIAAPLTEISTVQSINQSITFARAPVTGDHRLHTWHEKPAPKSCTKHGVDLWCRLI